MVLKGLRFRSWQIRRRLVLGLWERTERSWWIEGIGWLLVFADKACFCRQIRRVSARGLESIRADLRLVGAVEP